MLCHLAYWLCCYYYFGSKSAQAFKKAQKQAGESNTIMEETLLGITAVKAFQASCSKYQDIAKLPPKSSKQGWKMWVLRGFFAALYRGFGIWRYRGHYLVWLLAGKSSAKSPTVNYSTSPYYRYSWRVP